MSDVMTDGPSSVGSAPGQAGNLLRDCMSC